MKYLESRNDSMLLMKTLPNKNREIERLKIILNTQCPQISVYGKYNHGKSTLLNALVGKNCFESGDFRVTTEIARTEHDSVIWCDTPGLDADVYEHDDELANIAMNESDCIFFVHNIRSGELDKKEFDFLKNQLSSNSDGYCKIYVILTQIDQLESDTYNVVFDKIKSQIEKIYSITGESLEVFPVSASRYIKGKAENKNKLVEMSNLNLLNEKVTSLKNELEYKRKNEKKCILNDMLLDISKSRTQLEGNINRNKVFIQSYSVQIRNIIRMLNR